jgi:hypothetical protein
MVAARSIAPTVSANELWGFGEVLVAHGDAFIGEPFAQAQGAALGGAGSLVTQFAVADAARVHESGEFLRDDVSIESLKRKLVLILHVASSRSEFFGGHMKNENFRSKMRRACHCPVPRPARACHRHHFHRLKATGDGACVREGRDNAAKP